MNPDDDYQAWLDVRRGESPPADLTDRIMSAVCEAASSRSVSRTDAESPRAVWRRVLPYLVCSVAVIVLTVRVASIVSLFVVASPIADVTLIELEKSHEP